MFAQTRVFFGEYGIFHLRWLTKGRLFFRTHGKVNIRRKSQQHPKRDPVVKPRRLWLCGFPRFCSVSHGYTSQNFDCVPQQSALHSFFILNVRNSAQDDTKNVCAAVCVCLRTTDGRPYGKHGAPIGSKSNIGENSGHGRLWRR